MTPENPYIGLRFFDEDTAQLFFGRDEYVADLVEKLLETRFLAVLGHSGSGKSSLVRAGLIPALRAEQNLDERGDRIRWIVVKFRPETTPIAALAKALDTCPELGIAGSEADLLRGPLGIVEAYERAKVDGTRLLILADQFEELFRLEEEVAGQPGAREEAAAFVKLLLQANRHPHVYVVLTMRSDYLKDCARYRDLPERINRGIYLVPRMTRDELELAIVGPAKGMGVGMDPPLVQRLLNDAAGPDLDHLPLIEHLLARIWEQGASRRSLAIGDYEAAGGWGQCLSQHADELFKELEHDEPRVCEKVFRRLTLRDEGNRDVRSRATLGQLVEWCGGKEREVRRVVSLFREKKAALLTPVGEGELPPETVLDITHESLIRNWTKLASTDGTSWIHLETEARETFRGLERRARREAGQRGELKGQELVEAEGLAKDAFTEAWVRRYFPPDSRQRVLDLVNQSVSARGTAKQTRLALAAVLCVLLGIAGWLWYQNAQLQVEQKLAAATRGYLVNPKDGLRYAYVPSGEFEMGCSKGDGDCRDEEKPSHRVQITKGFWMGQTEVTQDAYVRVTHKPNPSRFQGGDRPVESLSWDEANAYCAAAGLRLPTEAEWEYAARAGTAEARYGKLDDIAWYEANSSNTTHSVATKLPNPWGLYDMLGNVWEWTSDGYDPRFYEQSPTSDPQGPVKSGYKVVRGGSWSNGPDLVRASYRTWVGPSVRDDNIGFRCAGELR